MADTTTETSSATAEPIRGDELYGHAAELHNAGFRKMPEDAEPRLPEFSADAKGLRAAAKEVADKRGRAAPELVRDYRNEDGTVRDSKEAISLSRAARDLAAVRRQEAHTRERDEARALAADVEARRADLLQDDPDALAAAGFAAGADGNHELGADHDPNTARPPEGLDPQIAEALQHPQVRAAIAERIGEADTVRRSYSQGLALVGELANAVIASHYPELLSKTVAERDAAIARMSPERYAGMLQMLNRLSAVNTQQQSDEAQAGQTKQRGFADYAAEQDRRYDAMIKGTTPEQMQRLSDAVIAYAGELGVDRDSFMRLMQSQPLMRHAAFQKMMHDAAQYRLAQQARSELARRGVPTVQRPGTASAASRRNGELSTVTKKFNENPTLKNAAEMLAARRRAGR